ncbi:hypothetical protein EBR77_01395 [bacterium]|nr:hypothetical protein [bacterium]NBX78128.1 hypothetical protein [bacterium]
MKKTKSLLFFLCLLQVVRVAGADHTTFSKTNMERLKQTYETKSDKGRWMPLHIVQAAMVLAKEGDQRARAFLVTVFMVQPNSDTHCMRGSLEEQAQKVTIGFDVALGYRDLGILNTIQILRDKSLEDLERENPFIIKRAE